MPVLPRPSWLSRDDTWLAHAHVDAPQMTLIDDKLMFAIHKRKDVNSIDMFGRYGIRGTKDGTLMDYTKRLEWTESKLAHILGKPMGTNYGAEFLNESDIQRLVDAVAKTPYAACEIEEGDFRMPFGSPQQNWFYSKLKIAYDNLGIPFNHFGVYGGEANFNCNHWNDGVGGERMPNDTFFKNIIASQANCRASCGYFSTLEGMGVGAIVKNYAEEADYARQYYNKAFSAEVMAKGMGGMYGGIGNKKLIYLDWGKIESLGSNSAGWLHNGKYFERVVGNLGTVKAEGHPQVDYDWLLGCIFMIGFTRTRGYMPFDDTLAYGPNQMLVKPTDAQENKPVQWIPNGNNAAPYSDNGYPVEPTRWHDAGAEAAYYYNLTNRTASKPWLYADYRFAGSDTWITAQNNGNDILEHASAFDGPYKPGENVRRGRPDVRYRVNDAGTAIDWAAFDPSRGKDSRETIYVRPVPNRTYELTMQGCKLYVSTETV